MRLTSYGAAEEVTGSCHLLETRRHKVLLDCGLIQGRRKDELRNHDPFPFDPAAVDAVVLSHAHIDHSGRLPVLVRQGFRGPIYTHPASAELVNILLKDSARLNERDVERENRRRRRAGKPLLTPLYSEDDVARTLDQIREVRYDEPTEVAPGFVARLLDAGHIIGSAMVEVTMEDEGQTRVLAFSGDLGHRGSPILKDFKRLEKADMVLLESTYGDRLHRDWEDTLEEVKSIALRMATERGNIMIPAFSVGRTQLILYTMARYFKEWELDRYQIFLDSPMAIEASDIYLKYHHLYDEAASDWHDAEGSLISLPNLKLTRTAEESMVINEMSQGAIIIAGSGMMNGGRIVHHLRHNLWRDDAHLIIPGFQAPGTVGRKIIDGARHVKVHGREIAVNASVHTIGGLSAHADQEGLMEWYGHFEGRPPVLLVHGERHAMQALAGRLEGELGARARIARRGQSTDLLALRRQPQP
ncbi:MAG: MBL fold metallo-hydrolase [Gammaproteobacteria bacterium]|nr:MAG: MBL fold metallo-hydrolase [Gammaproteobacteria bacterium]